MTQVWQPKAPGQRVLVAWAYDARGAVGNSAPVDVIVAGSTSTPGPTPVATASLTPETTPIPPEPSEEPGGWLDALPAPMPGNDE